MTSSGARPAIPKRFIDALRELVGSVSVDDAERLRCATDRSWSSLFSERQGRPSLPDVVVRVMSDEEVAATLRLATDWQVPVIPRGGGSGVMGAAVPTVGGVVLDVSAMNRILKVDEECLTATVEAGINGRAFEDALNAHGFSFPHFPASAQWASVGGYVAARGSGVLSSRYGKIEDLVVALRVVTPSGEVIDTMPVSRHAAGPELTQLFVGSEGTLGVITRVTVKLIRVPEYRRFETVSMPALDRGIGALQAVMQRGIRPAVIRLYDAEAAASSLSVFAGRQVRAPTALLMFEGIEDVADAEAEVTLRWLENAGATRRKPDVCRTWWEHRYDSYQPSHYPQLPSMWGTIDAVAGYDRILDVYHGIRDALAPFAEHGLRLRTHFSHWYEWGTMVYPRFVIADTSSVADPLKLYHEIWAAGVEAILAGGGVINDHHGVGATLSPYLARQWGPAHLTLTQIKHALDPMNVMNPGKLGFATS
jgi:alkyldihydroxyacetonephosphate synthase